LLLAVVAVAACGASPIHRIAAPLVTPVPWAPLPLAAPKTQPQPTLVPVPAGTRACTTGDLLARFGYPNGAGGLNFRAVVLASKSASACQLSGTPQVQLVDAAGRPLPAPPGGAVIPTNSGPVLLDPGLSPSETGGSLTGTAYVQLTWRRDDFGACPPPAPAVAVVLSWPGSNGSINAPTSGDTAISLSVCTGLGVAPFAGTPPPAPEPPVWGADLSAAIESPIGRSGVVTYTLRLHNGGARAIDLAGDQCPNYVETLALGSAVVAKEVYQLNCAGMTIPAGGSIEFAMRLSPSQHTPGNYTLRWTLSRPGPGPPVDAQAIVALT